MSKASEAFEREIVDMVNLHRGECLPNDLPIWLSNEGVRPGAKITGAEGIGSRDRANKTDVVVYLENSEPIKISAKLRNADHFGNWYGHERFLAEFGRGAFGRMTAAATAFANRWTRLTTAPFVGVSICFGRRSGNTAQNFTDIFSAEDILTVARGFGQGVSVANCMYIANTCAGDIPGLIRSIQEITIESVNRATGNFKVTYRPVNPMTEYSNRGKNVYTRFQPRERQFNRIIIRDAQQLFALGNFVEVQPDHLNHNRILDDLEASYNIVIPRKPK